MIHFLWLKICQNVLSSLRKMENTFFVWVEYFVCINNVEFCHGFVTRPVIFSLFFWKKNLFNFFLQKENQLLWNNFHLILGHLFQNNQIRKSVSDIFYYFLIKIERNSFMTKTSYLTFKKFIDLKLPDNFY